MPENNKTPHGRSQDRGLISLEQPYEIRYWTETLGVSEEQLRLLVRMHGNTVDPIRQALNKKAA